MELMLLLLFSLGFHRTHREKSGGQKQAKCAPPPSVLDLARTSTNPGERADEADAAIPRARPIGYGTTVSVRSFPSPPL